MRIVALILAAACTRGAPAREPTQSPSAGSRSSVSPSSLPPAQPAPVLEFLVPDTATIADGRIVVVHAIGRGFDTADNVLEFGPAVFTRVRASATRDTITFTVPLEFQNVAAPPTRVEPGEYPVRIRVGQMRTASRTFRVLEPRGPRR